MLVTKRCAMASQWQHRRTCSIAFECTNLTACRFMGTRAGEILVESEQPYRHYEGSWKNR